MLRILVWKELLDHVRSLRFAISLVTIALLFILGAAVWRLRIPAERSSYHLGVEAYEEAIRNSAQQSLNHLLVSQLNLWLPTATLTFACGGQGRALPNVAVVWRATRISGFEQRADPNPMLLRLDPDWIFIVGTLGNLMALLLTYDAIAGEKERGTLRQLLANRVPRDQVLLAKYLAALAMAATPLIVGAAAALSIVQLGGAQLTASDVVTLACVLCSALLCVSTFVCLGLWASSRTHSAALALLAAIVIWALLAVFLPQAGVLAGEHFVKVPSLSEADKAVWSTYADNQGYEERVRAEEQAQRHYWDLLLRQVEVARDATLVSPVSDLRAISESLTVTGVVRHRAFVEQAHQYRRDLADFLRRKDAEDPDSAHGMDPRHMGRFSDKPVAPDEVPRFTFRIPGLRERLDLAQTPLLILVVANGVCFLGAYFSFRRYDAR